MPRPPARRLERALPLRLPLLCVLLCLGLLSCGSEDERSASGYLTPDAGTDLGASPDRDTGPQAEGDTGSGADAGGSGEPSDAGPSDVAVADLAAEEDASRTVEDLGRDEQDLGGQDLGPQDPDLGGQPAPQVGVWAHLQVHAALSEVPVLGEVRNETRALLRSEIRREGDQLVLVSEHCRIDIVGESDLVRTVIPDRFVASLEQGSRSIVFDDGGVLAARKLEVRGAQLADPENEALPSEPDDARVFDQDGDGHPGLTVRVTGLVDGEIYVVQRAWDELQGEEIGSDELRGLVRWADEQNILGTDNALLAGGAPSRPDPAAERSYFILRRLPGGEDCAWLAAHMEELFPELE